MPTLFFVFGGLLLLNAPSFGQDRIWSSPQRSQSVPATASPKPQWKPRRTNPISITPTTTHSPWKPAKGSPLPGSQPKRESKADSEGPLLLPIPGEIPKSLPDEISFPSGGPDPPQLPPPRPVRDPDKKDKKEELTDEQAVVVGAARNAVGLKDWKLAIERYQDYFRRFGTKQLSIRKEFAGVLVQAGRVADALRLYDQLVRENPKDVDLRISFADVAFLAKKYALAIEVLVPEVRGKPKNLVLATKLARAYVFAEKNLYALRVFDDYLSDVKPDTEELPIDFPALLVDLEFAKEALPYLGALLKEDDKNVELLTTLVRAYAKLDDRERALEVIQRLVAQSGAKPKLIELGSFLNDTGSPELGQSLFGQLLQVAPDNEEVLLGLARSYLQLFQPAMARKLLASRTPSPKHKRSYLQARAEYHQLVGEYLDAKHVYLQILEKTPEDHEVRLSLGSLYELPLREWEKAKAEYDKIPRNAPQYRAAQRSVARTLTSQRHFDKAIALLEEMMRGHPDDGETMGQLVRTLGKAGFGGRAVACGEAFAKVNERNRPALRSVRLRLGFVHLDMGRNHEARREFEKLLALPGGRIPDTIYGLYRAYWQLGDKERAVKTLREMLSHIGGDTRNRLLFADLFALDYLDDKAHEMIQAVIKWEPDNLAALIRLATIEGYFTRQSGDSSRVEATAKTILQRSPSNVRGHLDLARALSIVRRNRESIAVYQKLIDIDPDFFLPRREQARVMHSDSQYSTAQGAYHQVLYPSAEERLENDLLSLVKRYPDADELVGPYLKSDLVGTDLEAEVSKLVGSAQPSAALAFRRAFLDYRARSAEQALTRLEAEVKDKDWRPHQDIPKSAQLTRMEPTNTSNWFDKSQLHGGLMQTHCAIDAFSQDLTVDSREREAMIGLERAGLEILPKFRFEYDFFYQAGRDELARIQRHHLTGKVIVPYGDEDEYVTIGYTRAIYKPREDFALNGNILTAGFASKYGKCWHFFGTFSANSYRRHLKPRVTFDTGVRHTVNDDVKLNAGMFLNNVVENGESLRQDIYRYGFYLGTDLQYTRRWGAQATYRYARYSDENDFNELFAKTEYYLKFAPTELKVVGTLNLTGFREGTTIRSLIPGDITGALHPYFSPDFFAYYEGRIEWKQWLSRDYFTYSNQCWYALQYGIGFDESLNAYHKLRAMFQFDIRPWFSVGLDAKATLSEVYESASIFAFLELRCPWCCR